LAPLRCLGFGPFSIHAKILTIRWP
jgi:hypothetical protein